MNSIWKACLGLYFLWMSATGAWAGVGGGDEAGNGAGIAEHHVLSAYVHLGQYLKLCLESPDCDLEPKERELVESIQAHLPREYQNPRQLIFKSEAEAPGFFVIDGYLRIAKTGDQVGSPIYVNRDLLYQRNSAGDIRALSLESAVAVLIHEMGHHHGEKDHTALDYIGAKVKRLVSGVLQKTDLGPGRRNILATAFSLDQPGSFAQFLVSDGIKAMDLSAVLRSFIQCPMDSEDVKLLNGLSLYNLHWKRREGEPLTLMGDLVLYCESYGTSESEVIRGYGVELQLAHRRDASGTMRLQPGSASFKQVLCAENPSVCGGVYVW